MRFLKSFSSLAFSVLALSTTSISAQADDIILDSGTCYSYGCSAPSQHCSSLGGTFNTTPGANGAYNYTCTRPAPPVCTTQTVTISSGVCYSYGCSQPSQFCRSQGGLFSGSPNNQGGYDYVCNKDITICN